MTTEVLHSSPTEDGLQELLFGDLNGACVLGMGPDIWDLGQYVAPRAGARGRYIGVHTEGELVRDASRRSRDGNGNGNNATLDFHQVEEDLRLSRAAADALIARHAPSTHDGFIEVQRELGRLRTEQPLVADECVDLVFATGLRHLPSRMVRTRMLKDFHRVVKRGGRLVVLDVASDEDVSTSKLLEADKASAGELGRNLARDPDLIGSLADAGFYGVTLLRRDTTPWKVVDGVELRRVAVVAYKGKEGPCWEHFQAVMYRGPFSSVQDDDGHVYQRGQQTAVCQKTFDILSREPYRGQFEHTEPLIPVSPGLASPFPCNLPNAERDPAALKFRLSGFDRQTRSERPAESIDVSPAVAEDATNGAGGRRKSVVIFERSSPGTTSPSDELARSLRKHAAEGLDVRVVDLRENPDATLPGQLRFRLSMSGDACLPAIVVDGVLVAVGPLPERDEVEKLIVHGRGFGSLAFTNLKSLAAQAGGCGPSGCC